MNAPLPTARHVDFSECSGAVISSCGRYRYQLHRRWLTGRGWTVFIMLNPSTADDSVDDPTIRRCMDFAQRWGSEGIIVVNLFGWRATHPRELLKQADPVGPLNDFTLMEISTFAREEAFDDGREPRVVCAWGVNAAKTDRPLRVLSILARKNVQPLCLGVTKDGHPKHPLYVPGDTDLIPFRRSA